MNRFRFAVLAALFAVALPTVALAGGRTTDGPRAASGVDASTALVQLQGDPLTTSVRTKPAPGKKVDFSSAATRSERAQLSALRNEFKRWLRANAPRARVTGEFDIALNAVAVELNGTALATLQTAPSVVRAEYQGLFVPTGDEDPDLALIDAPQAWEIGGGVLVDAGNGVKVAIVDSGIDTSHPCFADEGDATETYPESNNMRPDNEVNGGTNDKVIYAETFNNRSKNRGYGTADLNGHGTHVAGTAACNLHTPAWIDGPFAPVDIPYDPSGVAPRALLGNFNVFPADVANARSEDILNALNRAYELGFDVVNMSLGGNSNGKQDLLTQAVNNFDRGGMVIATSAGNSGPGDETVGSPGSASGAIAAGASTVGHYVGTLVETSQGAFGAASGDFETVAADLTAELAVVTGTGGVQGLSTGCVSGNYTGADVAGKIALISRGGCTFSQKILAAQNAGAIAVLVVNNVAGDPTAMAYGGLPTEPTVPAYMVGLREGGILAGLDGQNVTINAELQYIRSGNDNIMAGFSSLGPTDVDYRVKPDIVAPGVNVLSSQPNWACTQTTPSCWAFYSGTSMASPHVAGAAAVVIQQHPSWSAADVRSALANTAVRGVLKDYKTGTTVVDNPNLIGNGLLNVANAVQAKAALNPVSLTFGATPSGAGQTRFASMVVKNLTATTQTFRFAVQTSAGVTFTVSPASVTLAPGASTTVTVRMSAPRGLTSPDQYGWLIVSAGGAEVAHAALYTRIK